MFGIIDQTIILYSHGNAVRSADLCPNFSGSQTAPSPRFAPLLPYGRRVGAISEGSLDDKNNCLGFSRRKNPQRIGPIKL
jgi:hypothetical protein